MRLAAKLTGWKIDIEGAGGETTAVSDGENVEVIDTAKIDTPVNTALAEAVADASNEPDDSAMETAEKKDDA